jgi:uncharacterized DUF497 family protein
MRYEWDERKNRSNQRKHHGVSFELAALAFEDEWALIGPDRMDESGEQRWHLIGAVSIELGSVRYCWWYMRTERTAKMARSSVSSRPAGLRSLSSADIESRVWSEGDRQAVRRASRAQASGDAVGVTEIPRLTAEQLEKLVRLRAPKRKVAVSVRLDAQVVEWLRSKGEGHLTRINDILSNLMEAERRVGAQRQR